MKTNNTAIIAADKNAAAYFQMMTPLQAKKVLYGMTLLQGDQRLSDSQLPELRTIAKMYDGFVIKGKAAGDLAIKLAKAYAEKYPNVLMTKKVIAQYTDARYRKLIGAVGDYGFDYIIEALRYGKAYVTNPANGIDEKQMLRAMRWEERREGQDAEASNAYHRRKGLELAGLGDMADELVGYSFIIANVYEMVEPVNMQYASAPLTVVDETAFEETTPTNGNQPLTVCEMKIHFIEKRAFLEDFYGTKKPVCPAGYSEEELTPDSVIVGLAHKGLLKDSKEVLDYVELQSRYVAMLGQMSDEFNWEELNVIMGYPARIKALIDNAW